MTDIFAELGDMFDEAAKGADHKTLGETLIEKRESLKLKKVDIANSTKLSESLIGKIENGELTDIKISTMKKLCLAYGVSPSLFILHMGIDEELKNIEADTLGLSIARNSILKASKAKEQF